MKKIVSIVLALGVFTTALAQSKSEMPAKLNCVKINPLSLLANTINVQYERVIHPKMSVNLQARYTLPRIYNANVLYPEGTSFSNLKLSALTITPEFRYYTKQAMRGFYVAPYLRYRQINLDFDLPISNNGSSTPKPFNGKSTAYGGGLMIGIHQHLGNKFSLDFCIIGLQLMKNNVDINAAYNLNLSAADQEQLLTKINTNLSNVDRFIKDLSVVVGPNSAQLNGSYLGIGLRGLGLTLGYRF